MKIRSYRNHRHKSFNYLLKEFNHKKKKGESKKTTKRNEKGRNKMKVHTKYDINGKSTIRDLEGVFTPLVFADFNYLLEGKQSLTDVDGQLEINGNIFLLEAKSHYSSINGGQLVSLFHNAYNTWKRGKIGQLTYRVDTGKRTDKGEELFDFVIYGSAQFKQYEAGLKVIPHYELDKTNDWLARRLHAFQMKCIENHDRDVQIRNRNLFGSVDGIKRHLQTRGAKLPF